MTEILNVDPIHPQAECIERAAALLRAGEVVGIPTDTIYGLATDAFNGPAAEKVFALKQRVATMPLLILVNSLEMARECMAGQEPLFEKLAERFWPGPLTMVVPAAGRIPRQVKAGGETIGIRLPSAPMARKLIAALGRPITASSANRSGQPDCRSAAEVIASIGEGLPLVLDGGPSGNTAASTVVMVSGEEASVLREGAIPQKAISDFLRS